MLTTLSVLMHTSTEYPLTLISRAQVALCDLALRCPPQLHIPGAVHASLTNRALLEK